MNGIDTMTVRKADRWSEVDRSGWRGSAARDAASNGSDLPDMFGPLYLARSAAVDVTESRSLSHMGLMASPELRVAVPNLG
jgi:hypothetical protein